MISKRQRKRIVRNRRDYGLKPNEDLSYVNLSGLDLRGTDLTGANLRYANLRYANLTNAKLTGANLRYANLRYANLSGADLSGADLGSDPDLSPLFLPSDGGADLTNANLRSANLEGADLTNAKLSGANLAGAQMHCLQGCPSTLPSGYRCRPDRDCLKPKAGFSFESYHIEPEEQQGISF